MKLQKYSPNFQMFNPEDQLTLQSLVKILSDYLFIYVFDVSTRQKKNEHSYEIRAFKVENLRLQILLSVK